MGMYVHVSLTRVCCTLIPEIHVRPEMLGVVRYIDMLMCVILQLDA